MRRCEVLQYNLWIEIPFEQLQDGDVFRMFDDLGNPVTCEEKSQIFQAVGSAFLDENGHKQVRYCIIHAIKT